MGIFSKQKQEFDEAAIRDFWTWFQNNKTSDIYQIQKEISTRLADIYGSVGNVGWYEMGWDIRNDSAYITFWADGSKQMRQCFEQLIKHAPGSIKETWKLRVEN